MKTITLMLKLTLQDGLTGEANIKVYKNGDERLTPFETALRDTLGKGIYMVTAQLLKDLSDVAKEAKE